MKIGKPTHYRPNNRNVSACGIVSPDYAAYDARDCDCLLCIKTDKYKVYMNKPKSRAADNAALRARRKKAGLVSFREYVTPEEKLRLVVCLDNLRGITPTKEL